MARKPASDVKDEIAKAVEVALPALPPYDPGDLQGRESSLVRSGLVDHICWLRFCGFSNRQVSKKLNVSHDSVDRLTKTPYFKAIFEQRYDTMIGMVEEKARLAVLETVMEAIEKKRTLMRAGNTHPQLQDKIADDFIKMGERMLRAGTGAPSDVLKAIFEKTVTLRGKDGQKTEITARIEGTANEVAAAIRPANEPGGSGNGTWNVPFTGEDSRNEGAVEVAEGAGEGGDHSGDGETGVP